MGFSSFSSYGTQVAFTKIFAMALPPSTLPPSISTVLTNTDRCYCCRYDSNGKLYFGSNGIIQIFHNNRISSFAGNGTFGFSGDGGQVSEALIGDVRGISFDSVGNLYFADLLYHVIRKIDIVTGVISTVVGTGGVAGNSGMGGQGKSALLNKARDVIFDVNDNMYIVCSTSSVINKVDTNGIITNIGGTGSSGYTGDGGQATLATMNAPAQIAIFQNSLYIADGNNFVIRKIDLQTGVISTVVGAGQNTSTGSGGPAIMANLQFPRGVAFDVYGNMYISEKPHVRKIDANGIITLIAGTGRDGNTGDGGDPQLATFGQALYITFDSVGDLLVCDSNYNNIRKLSGLSP